jgi:hypothetical protein
MVSAIDPTKPVDNLPAKKADVRNNFAAAKREIEALQITQIKNGDPVDMRFALLTRPTLRWYTERIMQVAANADGLVTIRMRNGNVTKLSLERNVTSLIFLDVPGASADAVRGRAASITLIVTQNSRGGRTISWPSSVKWAQGAIPAVSSSPNAIDIYAFVSVDAGETWFGFVGGQDFR